MVEKIKKIKLDDPVKYYAHYLMSTNEIVSINNHRDDSYAHAVEITFEQYSGLVSGVEKFSNYYIGTVIDTKGLPTLGLISKKINVEHNFKNRLIKIVEQNVPTADIEIHWDEHGAKWIFVMTQSLRQMFYDNKLSTSGISFFIVLGKDPDFLIRTININFQTLALDKIEVPFDSKKEKDINGISLIASISSIEYSLKVWRYNE